MYKKKIFTIVAILILILISLIIYVYQKTDYPCTTDYKKKFSSNTIELVVHQTETVNNDIDDDFYKYTQEEYEKYLKLRSFDNVRMSLKDNTVTNTSATIIIEDNNVVPYGYGDGYILETKVLGMWIPLIPKCGIPTWDDYTLIIKNGETELPVNWSKIYGSLKKGKYRLVKYEQDRTNNNHKRFIIDFNIE